MMNIIGRLLDSAEPSVRLKVLVDWGGTGKKRLNEFVSADALSVLKAAGRVVELP